MEKIEKAQSEDHASLERRETWVPPVLTTFGAGAAEFNDVFGVDAAPATS